MSQGMYNFKLSEQALDDLVSQGHYAEHANQIRRNERQKSEFSTSFDETETTYYLTVSGALNSNTFTQFKTLLMQISGDSEKVIVIDCSQLLSINSSGLSSLAKLARNFSNRITMMHVNKPIMALLDMSGLLKVIHIEPVEMGIH